MCVETSFLGFATFFTTDSSVIRFNKTLSNYLPLNAGVPQGTKLGPIGFQVLINDAAQDAKVVRLSIIDDLTFAENKAHDDQGNLQDDLDDFVDWAKSSGLKLNPKKVPSS